MPLSIELRGFQELAQKLQELPNAITADLLEAALKGGAKIGRDAAAVNAPRDPASGKHMGDHIVVRTIEKDGVHAVVGIAPQGWSPEKGKGEGPFFYWRFFEYGTSKMPARPFMRPAIDENRDAITQAVADKLRDRLEEVMR